MTGPEPLILAAGALTVLSASMLFAYVVGLTKKTRSSEQYKAGLASGYRKGRIEGEAERDRLQAELDILRADMQESVDRIATAFAKAEQITGGVA